MDLKRPSMVIIGTFMDCRGAGKKEPCLVRDVLNCCFHCPLKTIVFTYISCVASNLRKLS